MIFFNFLNYIISQQSCFNCLYFLCLHYGDFHYFFSIFSNYGQKNCKTKLFILFIFFLICQGIFFGSIIATLVLAVINIFVFSVFVEAVIGLFIGVLYVIVDTQMIIHRTESGIYDVFSDAKLLFLDLVRIFIEILKILSSKKKKDD